MAAGNEVVHVAVAPPAVLDEEIVKKVAGIVGKSPYESRLRLTGKIPKIIANYDNVEGAAFAAGNLRQLGLTVIVVPDSELRRPWQIFKARSLKFEEQAITFYDRMGQSKRIEAKELFLILSARMQILTETDITKTTRKINITATILTGGIPITKKVKEKTKSITSQIESFIRLYTSESPEPAVEIRQPDFDYSFLRSEMASSAAANFNIAGRKIREFYPQAIYDDSLLKPFGASTTATMEHDSIEANCKMIYWYHVAVKS
jgi:hypothetical protein